jgi:capsular polysaccharide biosynthesis protein
MDINEVLVRVFRGHWRLFLVCLLVPVLVVGVLVTRAPRTYESAARVQAGTVLPGSDTEADALLNLVKGVVTSPAQVTAALAETRLHRDLRATVGDIDVTRLGSSTVFDVAVTDAQPHAAAVLAQALAARVVDYLNNVGDERTKNLLDGLSKRQQDLSAQRQQTATQLTLATDAVARANLSAQLAGIDQQLSDISSTTRQLELSGTSAGSPGAAALVSPASAPLPSARPLSADLGLAGVLGLVLALLVVTALELLRPRIAGARALGRDLGTPVVGRLEVAASRRARRLDERGSHAVAVVRTDPELLVAVLWAAQRAGADPVLLAGPAPASCLRAAAAALRAQLSEPERRAAGNGKVPAGTAMARPRPGSGAPTDGPAGAVPGPLVQPAAVLLAERAAASHEGAAAAEARWRVGISALDEVDAGRFPTDPGLLVLVPRLALLRDARRLGDLAAATGWPLLGVVDLRWRGPRRARRSGDRS